MQFRPLGNSGLQVSTVGLGCMNFAMMNGEAESAAIVQRAIELGVNLFDVADVYGNRGQSEEYLGKALAKGRQHVLIATKFAGPMSADHADMQGGSRRWIMRAVEGSLRRLGTDYIDLYQMHRFDPLTPIEETLRALDDLVRSGKVRYLGSSNFAAWQIVDAQWTARVNHLTRFVAAQNRYSVLSREIERELSGAVQAHGVGVLPYFPLESGLLTGKYRTGEQFPADSRLAKWGPWASNSFASADKLAAATKLGDLAERHGHSLLHLAMGWLLSRSWVSSVIAGVTSIAQLEHNVAAGAAHISSEEHTEIDRISPPPPAPLGPGPARPS